MAEVVIPSPCVRCVHSSSSPNTSSAAAAFLSPSFKFQSQFHGRKIVAQPSPRRVDIRALPIQMKGLFIGKSWKWWEKGLQPNMKEISCAQDLVDSLLNAGDQLVILQFYSPGCGGCKALHPKICQFADRNPDAVFLQVNHEEHKSMCYTLNVHVLPFFRFYRGAHGRLCSFSCTNATINKFKDALAKHSTERCSLGPARGLEELELLALAANKDLSFTYVPKAQEPPLPLTLPALKSRVPSESESGLVKMVGFEYQTWNTQERNEDKELVATA